MKSLIFFVGVSLRLLSANEANDLKKALFFLPAHPTFWVTFAQSKKIQKLTFNLKSQGHLEVKDQHRAVWQIDSPAFLRVEMQPGEVKLSSDPEGKNAQVFRQDPQSTQLAGGESAWMDLLVFDEVKVAEKFAITRLGPRSFQLIPRMANAPFRKIDCFTTPGGFFEKIRIDENADDAIEIKFGAPRAGAFTAKAAPR